MRREARKKIKRFERASALLDYIGIPVAALIVMASFTLFSVAKIFGFLCLGAGFLTLIGVVTASIICTEKAKEVAIKEQYRKLEEKLHEKQQRLSEENVIVEDFVNENDDHKESQVITNITETNNNKNIIAVSKKLSEINLKKRKQLKLFELKRNAVAKSIHSKRVDGLTISESLRNKKESINKVKKGKRV